MKWDMFVFVQCILAPVQRKKNVITDFPQKGVKKKKNRKI